MYKVRDHPWYNIQISRSGTNIMNGRDTVKNGQKICMLRESNNIKY